MPFIPYLLAVVAGFAMLNVPVAGTFLAGIAPLLEVLGLLAVIVFSIVILINALLRLFNYSKEL